MRVDDALRQAGRAARVTHRRGLVLVEVGLDPVVGRRAREQLLVRVLDDEDVLDLRAVAELLEQRQERAVDDHGLVAGVVRDVREVVRVQAQVQRVQHEAAARDAEVRLVMLVVVPAERRDAVAALRGRAAAARPRAASSAASSRAYVVRWKLLSGRRVTISPRAKYVSARLRMCGNVSWKSIICPSTEPPRARRERRRRARRRRLRRGARTAGSRGPRATTRACRTGAADAPT